MLRYAEKTFKNTFNVEQSRFDTYFETMPVLIKRRFLMSSASNFPNRKIVDRNKWKQNKIHWCQVWTV